MGRIIPYSMENKKCLKPPTRYIIHAIIHFQKFNEHQPIWFGRMKNYQGPLILMVTVSYTASIDPAQHGCRFPMIAWYAWWLIPVSTVLTYMS